MPAEAQHTSEPWEINPRLSGFPQIATPDGVVIAKTDCSISAVYWVNDSKRAQANARRIVACVNACKGINPEAVPEMLEAIILLCDTTNPRVPCEHPAFSIARAAISKATKKE